MRQAATPAPVGGVTPPSPPVPAPSVSQEENDPVDLPRQGHARITFSSSQRELPIAVNDLREFGIGKGKLSSGPIPLGEYVSAEAEIGSDTPLELSDCRIVLAPVIGVIDAATVATARRSDPGQPSALGVAGAAAGGIVGGVLGGALGPLGLVKGAETGGVMGGRAGQAVADFFAGDQELAATLTQGELQGHLKLTYRPFIALKLSVTGLSWLADVEATLQTVLALSVIPAFALTGSTVRLRFRDGRLVRTVIDLHPTAALRLALTASGALRVGATLLPILDQPDKKAGEDPGVLHGELTTNPFPLFELGGELSTTADLRFAKGSPLQFLGNALRPGKPDEVRDRVGEGLKKTRLPFKSRAEVEERGHMGLGHGTERRAPPDGGERRGRPQPDAGGDRRHRSPRRADAPAHARRRRRPRSPRGIPRPRACSSGRPQPPPSRRTGSP